MGFSVWLFKDRYHSIHRFIHLLLNHSLYTRQTFLNVQIQLCMAGAILTPFFFIKLALGKINILKEVLFLNDEYWKFTFLEFHIMILI